MGTNGVTVTGHTMLFFSSMAQHWIKSMVLLKFHLICAGNLQVVPDCSQTDTNNCSFKGPECQPCLFSPLLFSSIFCWEPPCPPGMTSSADANAPSVCTELHGLFQLKGSQHRKWIVSSLMQERMTLFLTRALLCTDNIDCTPGSYTIPD